MLDSTEIISQAMQLNEKSTDEIISTEERKRVFGRPYKLARLEQDLTQAAVCNISKTDQYYLSQIERGIGNPSLDKMIKLARSIGKELKITFD